MFDWWNTLTIASQVFYCVAIPATLVLLIQTVLMFLGIGEDGDADELPDPGMDASADMDADGDVDGVFDGDGDGDVLAHESGFDGLRVFTLRGIIAFFVVFGWVGVVMDAANLALYITIPVSILCGLATMVGLAFLIRAVMRLRNDGNLDNRNAIGTSGKVYLAIPPSRTGEGKVQLMLQGSYVERNAVTDETEPIPTGCEVVVIGISGQTDLVVKRK